MIHSEIAMPTVDANMPIIAHSTLEGSLRPLESDEIEQVSGGFVCGGLCIAGAAAAAGFLFGAGVGLGYHAAKNK